MIFLSFNISYARVYLHPGIFKISWKMPFYVQEDFEKKLAPTKPKEYALHEVPSEPVLAKRLSKILLHVKI